MWLGWVLSFIMQTSHLINVTDALLMDANDVLGGFNHPL